MSYHEQDRLYSDTRYFSVNSVTDGWYIWTGANYIISFISQKSVSIWEIFGGKNPQAECSAFSISTVQRSPTLINSATCNPIGLFGYQRKPSSQSWRVEAFSNNCKNAHISGMPSYWLVQERREIQVEKLWTLKSFWKTQTDSVLPIQIICW